MSDGIRIKKPLALILYCALFYALWALFEFKGKALIDSAVSGGALSQFIKSGVIKNLVWTVPALVLAKRYSSELYVGAGEMFKGRITPIKYLPWFMLFTLFGLGGALIRKGNLEINPEFDISSVIIVMFVGLTEETVFRGWLLNATVDARNQYRALFINALMFMLIHFPKWIYEGALAETFSSFSFLTVLLLSFIFGWTFIKSRNIFVPILLHMYWDLLMFMFN